MKALAIFALTTSIAAAQINVGTNSFDVVFESNNLSFREKSRIIYDINRCRQLWAKSQVRLYDGGALYVYDGNVIFTPYFDNKLEVPNTLLTNSTGALSLLVSKPVSDSYIEAFAFADANSNIIAAADAFVDALSDPNTVCNTMAEYFEYVLSPTNTQVNLPEGFDGLKNYEYSKPSVMAFGYLSFGPEPSPGVTSNLFMKLQYRSTEVESIDQFPCIWHDGKWKFFYWPN